MYSEEEPKGRCCYVSVRVKLSELEFENTKLQNQVRSLRQRLAKTEEDSRKEPQDVTVPLLSQDQLRADLHRSLVETRNRLKKNVCLRYHLINRPNYVYIIAIL